MSSAFQFLTGIFSLKGETAVVIGGTGGFRKTITPALAQVGASLVSIKLPKDPLRSVLAEVVRGVGSNTENPTLSTDRPSKVYKLTGALNNTVFVDS